MSTFALALAARPLAMLFLFGGIALPISLLLKRFIPDGKAKEWLYSRYMEKSVKFRWAAVILIYLFIGAVSVLTAVIHEGPEVLPGWR